MTAPILSKLLPDNEYVVGIDIGGTKIRIARVNSNGQILGSKTYPTPCGRPNETLAETFSLVETTIHDLIERARTNGHTCRGLGIAVPGPTDRRNGMLLFAPSLGWKKIPFREQFEQCFGLPVQVSNDVQAAALGELHFGWGSKGKLGNSVQNLFWMTISTGIGGSIIINRELYEGKNGIAGEVGHIILRDNGPIGPCGHAGCLESLASGPAITSRAKEIVSQSGSSYILAMAGDLDGISPPILTKAAKEGDLIACRLWTEAGMYVGKAISYVTNLLDPDIVVLGGGVIVGAGEFIMNPIVDFVHRYSLSRRYFPPIVQTVHGTTSGVVGAATLILLSLASK